MKPFIQPITVRKSPKKNTEKLAFPVLFKSINQMGQSAASMLFRKALENLFQDTGIKFFLNLDFFPSFYLNQGKGFSSFYC